MSAFHTHTPRSYSHVEPEPAGHYLDCPGRTPEVRHRQLADAVRRRQTQTDKEHASGVFGFHLLL